jgi:hypothetical protein
MGQRCTLSVDVYSLGVLLVELTTFDLGARRGDWRLPRAPAECPQVGVRGGASAAAAAARSNSTSNSDHLVAHTQ